MEVEGVQVSSGVALSEQCEAGLRRLLGAERYRTWFDQTEFELVDRQPPMLSISVTTDFRAQHIAMNFDRELRNVARSMFGDSAVYEVRAGSVRVAEVQPCQQADLFVPAVGDLAIKDDVHLMGIAPFTLQPRGETRTRLVYRNVDGTNIEITAHPDHGLPSAHDHLIVQMMESDLAARANLYRKQLAYYEDQKAVQREIQKPEPPEPKFRPTTKQIMEFCGDLDVELGRRPGGKQSSLLEGRLDRLKNTTTKVRQTGASKKRVGTFSFISDYRVMSETESGVIDKVEIDIPSWIYDGIVGQRNPTILTFDRRYAQLKSPVEMFLYRLFRTKVRDGEAFFPFDELHARSGSRQAQKEFNRDRTAWAKEKGDQGFFDWGVSVSGEPRKRGLKVTPKMANSTDV